MKEYSMKTELLKPNQKMESPRNCEDSGDMTPSVWGKGGTKFAVSQANEGSSGVSFSEGVDLVTGKRASKK